MLDSSFVPLRKILVSYFALKFVRLVGYFPYFHDMTYLAPHPLVVLFTGNFFFQRCTVWCLCECSLNSFVFAIFHKNFHFFSGDLLSWRNWWQIMSKLTYRGDSRRPTGHSNSYFLSEFRITVTFRSFSQRICFLIPKLTILSKSVSVDSAAADWLHISLQTS